jgi:multidrug resistance efflux pump
MEALAVEIETFVANGNLEQAEQSLSRARTLHGATWLSSYDLLLANAQVDAAEGRTALARRTIAEARTRAAEAGCGACETQAFSLQPR